MSVYVIADTHLSHTGAKSMEIFGPKWDSYVKRIEYIWNGLISQDDTTVIVGDISWAMNFSQCIEDFDFINKLNGKKIIIKGNHDYWWDTMKKMNFFLERNGFDTIKILHNNAYIADNIIIAGSRGWFVDESNDELSDDAAFNIKIMNREVGRLAMSLSEAKKLKETNKEANIFAFIHYPPVYGDYVCEDIVNLLCEEKIEKCYYGHIHNAIPSKLRSLYKGIRFELVSADYVRFCPVKVY